MVVTAAATVRGFAADRAACRGLFPSGLAACGGLFPSPPLPETEAAPQTPCRGCAPDPGGGFGPVPWAGFRCGSWMGACPQVLGGGSRLWAGVRLRPRAGAQPRTPGGGSRPPWAGVRPSPRAGISPLSGVSVCGFAAGQGFARGRGPGAEPMVTGRGGEGKEPPDTPPYPKDGLRGGRGGALACVGRPKARDDADGLRPHRGREPGRRGRSLEALGKGVPLRQRRRAVSPNRTTTTPDRSRCGRA